MTCHNETEISVIDPIEVRRAIDRQSLKHLGITGDEFLARRARGEYAGVDEPTITRLMGAAEDLD